MEPCQRLHLCVQGTRSNSTIQSDGEVGSVSRGSITGFIQCWLGLKRNLTYCLLALQSYRTCFEPAPIQCYRLRQRVSHWISTPQPHIAGQDATWMSRSSNVNCSPLHVSGEQ